MTTTLLERLDANIAHWNRLIKENSPNPPYRMNYDPTGVREYIRLRNETQAYRDRIAKSGS